MYVGIGFGCARLGSGLDSVIATLVCGNVYIDIGWR